MQVTNEYTFEEKHFDTVKLKYVKSKTSRNKKSKNKDQKNSLNISSIIHKERIPIKEKIFHIDFFYSDLKKGSHKIKIITNQSVSTKNRSFQDLTMKNNRKRNFLYFLNEHSENYYKLSNEKKIQFVKNIPTIQTAIISRKIQMLHYIKEMFSNQIKNPIIHYHLQTKGLELNNKYYKIIINKVILDYEAQINDEEKKIKDVFLDFQVIDYKLDKLTFRVIKPLYLDMLVDLKKYNGLFSVDKLKNEKSKLGNLVKTTYDSIYDKLQNNISMDKNQINRFLTLYGNRSIN